MKRHRLLHEPISHSVIGAFYEVYNTLGYGFLEHIYILALDENSEAAAIRYGAKSGFVSCTRARSSPNSAWTW
jgi:hypothetical protein